MMALNVIPITAFVAAVQKEFATGEAAKPLFPILDWGRWLSVLRRLRSSGSRGISEVQ